MAGCSSSIKTIEISNTGSFDRNDEIIQINDKEFLQLFEESDKWILKNNHNQEIGYQLVKNENGNLETFIFQAAVPANKKVAYHLKKGNPSPVEPKTFARFVPERKDDFAWENDLAAYRMYGPALAGENPSNGVDLWLKRTKELIVDTFYFNELQKGRLLQSWAHIGGWRHCSFLERFSLDWELFQQLQSSLCWAASIEILFILRFDKGWRQVLQRTINYYRQCGNIAK